MAARGRRPGAKLNDETMETILMLGKKGATNGVIAAAVGIHTDTFQGWLKRGREGLQSIPENEERELDIYEEMFFKLDQVRAQTAAEMSEVVINTAMSGAPNTWQAAMTFLERRYPNEWGKRETQVHEGSGTPNGLPQINILVLNDPNARSAHRDLLRSVDRDNRSSARLAIGPSLGGEREAGSGDGDGTVDVDSR